MSGGCLCADCGEVLLLLGVGAGGLGDGEPGVLEWGALDAREFGGGGGRAEVESGSFEAIVDDAGEQVGEHAGLHVATDAGFAFVVDGPELEGGLEGAEGVLHAPQAAVGERHLATGQGGGDQHPPPVVPNVILDAAPIDAGVAAVDLEVTPGAGLEAVAPRAYL